MKKLLYFVAGAPLFLISGVAHAQNRFIDQFLSVTSTNQTYYASDVIALMTSIGGFLIVAGGIVAGIVIIVSGLMYMAAGSNTARTAAAKSTFKNGIIGALILFAAGVIVNTIFFLATNWQQFFS
jgi:hypothetical protein